MFAGDRLPPPAGGHVVQEKIRYHEWFCQVSLSVVDHSRTPQYIFPALCTDFLCVVHSLDSTPVNAVTILRSGRL